MFSIAGSLHRQHLQAPSPSAWKLKGDTHGALSSPHAGRRLDPGGDKAEQTSAQHWAPNKPGPRRSGRQEKKEAKRKCKQPGKDPGAIRKRLALFPPAHPGLSFKSYSQSPILFRPPVFFLARPLLPYRNLCGMILFPEVYQGHFGRVAKASAC